jgi:hypothetical protein
VDTLWAAVGAVAATVQAVVVVLAAAYAWGQLREARNARNLSVLIRLNDVMDTDSADEDRKRLFNELPDDLTEPLSPEDYALIRLRADTPRRTPLQLCRRSSRQGSARF